MDGVEVVSRMKNYFLLFIVFMFSPATFAAGPAGEVVSLNCSYAIASALRFIKEQNININVSREDGEFTCVTPSKEEIYIRLQSPRLAVSDKKYMFIINARSYEVMRSSFGR